MHYKITDFGAVTSDALQTEAIQKAIDTCFLQGGGTVEIPTGIFRTGGIRLRSHVTLLLKSGAILEGSQNPEDYMAFHHDPIEPIDLSATSHLNRSLNPYSRWHNSLIRAINAEDIAIIGEDGAYIDGVNCYDPQGEENYRGPHLITMQNCANVTLIGYTARRSANWAHAIFHTRNIVARNLKVFGGHDGFDVRTCDDITIENCEFITGDDAIAGFDNCGVFIRNCYIESSCSAFRFGGTDVTIEQCLCKAPARFGFRLQLTDEEKRHGVEATPACRHNTHDVFLYYCDFRAAIRKTPGNILIRNCVFEQIDELFHMNFNRERWCENRPLTSIKFENCTITGVCSPSLIVGGEDEPITFELENMRIQAKPGHEDIPLLKAEHYKKISLKNVALENFAHPTILAKKEGEICADPPLEVLELAP